MMRVFRLLIPMLLVTLGLAATLATGFGQVTSEAFGQTLDSKNNPQNDSEQERVEPVCMTEAIVDGAISTATYDFVDRALKRSQREGCKSLLLHINTPGGSLQTTRKIVEKILASPIPVLCLVGPEGGHAGSAGALILLACHVSGALPATNIGAATPVAGGGASLGDDMRKKMVEDTKSWAVSLAKKRGRSVAYAEQIVTEAKALDSEEAAKVGGIDILAGSVADFLRQAKGRDVLVSSSLDGTDGKTVTVEVGGSLPIAKDWRERLLSFLTDPEFSYLLFMAALGLLYFELTHPGAIAPGVAGTVLLVISLVAFHKLDVAWGGVGLMGLGIAFLIAEAFVPSFGALGVGGIISLAVGSILLYDPASGGLTLSLWLSLGAPLTLGLSMLALGIWIFRSRRRGNESLAEAGVVEQIVTVERVDENGRSGSVMVRGEIWSFECATPVAVGDKVRVLEAVGLKLKVEKIKVSEV
jgi:membrane-bound serine protease (ClpP class)